MSTVKDFILTIAVSMYYLWQVWLFGLGLIGVGILIGWLV